MLSRQEVRDRLSEEVEVLESKLDKETPLDNDYHELRGRLQGILRALYLLHDQTN